MTVPRIRALLAVAALGAATITAVVAGATPASAATARYTITDLGALGTGDLSVALGLNKPAWWWAGPPSTPTPSTASGGAAAR